MTVIDFAPSQAQAFQFQAVLDGTPYNVIVTWNMYRGPNNATQGFYVNINNLDGTPVVTRALVGSDAGKQLQSLSWSKGRVTATTVDPHGLDVGQTTTLTVSGASPTAYNGLQKCLVTGTNTFSYALASNPGAATAFGQASFDISLTSGYFASTLVYRAANRQFEVNP